MKELVRVYVINLLVDSQEVFQILVSFIDNCFLFYNCQNPSWSDLDHVWELEIEGPQ